MTPHGVDLLAQLGVPLDAAGLELAQPLAEAVEALLDRLDGPLGDVAERDSVRSWAVAAGARWLPSR